MRPWVVEITMPAAGFSPAYWADPWASFGKKNQAGAMASVDIRNPAKMTQPPALANLTNGTETGAVTTLLKHILHIPASSDVAFGTGGSKLYKFSSSAVTSDANFPHTIDKAAVTGEDGESVAYYGGKVYYLYNYTGGGDIGLLTLPSTFDNDWGSTVPTGAAALQNAPHPSVVGNDDVLYFANGRYVGWYDKTSGTIAVDDLDLPEGGEVVDVRYNTNRVVAAFNLPNITGNNAGEGIIYFWDGVSASWDDQPNPRIMGKIGALYIKDGDVYVWYKKTGEDQSKLGYVFGNGIKPIANWSGSLPNFAQVGEIDNHLAWVSDGKLFIAGSLDSNYLPSVTSQISSAGYSTAGGFAMPFGTPMFASTNGTNYRLAKWTTTYEVGGNWKSVLFDVVSSMIDKVEVEFDPPGGAGARVDIKLEYNLGAGTLTLQKPGQTGSITYTNDSGQRRKEFQPQLECNNFRVFVDWASGNATYPQSVRKITVLGHTKDKVS